MNRPSFDPRADSPPASRRAVVSWVLYDLANTIFSMGVVSLYFSLYVRATVGVERADRVYGTITAVSMGLIFLLSPFLGAMTDRARRRMPFLVWSTAVCCLCTALLGRGSYRTSAILFIVANAAYQAGSQFYDALLPDVTTETNRGRISGIGVGIGYLGSYLAVGIGLMLGTDHYARLFTIIAVAFWLFALPCFVFVRERGNPHPQPIFRPGAIVQAGRETWAALRSSRQCPGLLRFLVGRVFYTDAINTVISYMSLYTVNVAIASGLSRHDGEVRAQLILMVAITCAVIGGIAWGAVTDRIGPKRTLTIVLWLWMATFTLASATGGLHLPLACLYVVACAAGVALGGTWAADRPYMLRLTPPNRVGEFYGLYGMVGRFSAVSGPVLWGTTTYLVVERGGLPPVVGQSIAVLILLVMVVVGYWVLRPVTDDRREWNAEVGL